MDIHFILGLIIGGSISWLVTHIYYKKSSKDLGIINEKLEEQEIIYKKLPDELRKVILEDNREKFSIPELKQLLYEKTIDPDVRTFLLCPDCGSNNLKESCLTDEVCTQYLFECEACGWFIRQDKIEEKIEQLRLEIQRGLGKNRDNH